MKVNVGIEQPESEQRRRRQGRWIDPPQTLGPDDGVDAPSDAQATAALGFLSPSGSRLQAAQWDVIPQDTGDPFKVRWPTLAGLSTSPISQEDYPAHQAFQFRGECQTCARKP